MGVRGLLLMAFTMLSIPVCFIRPMYGVLLWTIYSFLNPQSYSWDIFAFPWAEAVAAPTLFGMLFFERRLGRFAAPLFILMTILWIWLTTTTLVSVGNPLFAHHADDTWDRWQFVSKVLLMSACTISIVNSFERLRLLVLTIAASFGFYVLKALPFILTTGGAFRLFGPPQSMIADNNDFGLALDMTLPLFFFLAQTESKRWVKRLFVFLLIITIPAIFFTYSRGALVGLIALFLVMLAQSKRRFALLPVAAFAVLVAVYFTPGEWQDRMNPSRPEAMDASARSRLDSWAFARALAADYPITGGGFATFTAELYDRYSPTENVAVIGPHSVYFQVLAEHGYVGLGLYLILVLACLLTLRRVRRMALTRGDTHIAQYAQMFQFSLLAFLAAGTFLGRAYFDYFFTIIVCVVILRHIATEGWATATKVERIPAAALHQSPATAWHGTLGTSASPTRSA